MKKILFIICLTFMLAGCTHTSSNVNSNIDMSERLITITNVSDFISIAESISPAIVGISSSDITGESVGSGVCVASGGYVLTNSHVVLNPNNIKLHMLNKQTAKAQLVYNDPASDLAILKTNQSLPFLPLAQPDNLSVGEEVLAVGTPLSLLLKHTFTKGILSAVNRTLSVSSLAGEAYMHNLIQHDASINPGNSGGPLINKNGEIIGINTLKISSSEGLGFAIPVKNFFNLMTSLTSNVSFQTPYLGVFGYDAEIANYYQLTNEEKGMYIIDVASDSPLRNWDVNSGDIITKFNDTDIHNTLDLRSALLSNSAHQQANIEIIKGNKKYRYSVNLAKHPVNKVIKNQFLLNDGF